MSTFPIDDTTQSMETTSSSKQSFQHPHNNLNSDNSSPALNVTQVTPMTPTAIYVGYSPQLGQVGLQCTGPYMHIYAYDAPVGSVNKLTAATWPQISRINVHRIGWTAAKFIITFHPGRLPERLLGLVAFSSTSNSILGGNSRNRLEVVFKEGRQLLADLLARGLLQKRNALFNVHYVPTYANLPVNSSGDGGSGNSSPTGTPPQQKTPSPSPLTESAPFGMHWNPPWQQAYAANLAQSAASKDPGYYYHYLQCLQQQQHLEANCKAYGPFGTPLPMPPSPPPPPLSQPFGSLFQPLYPSSIASQPPLVMSLNSGLLSGGGNYQSQDHHHLQFQNTQAFGPLARKQTQRNNSACHGNHQCQQVLQQILPQQKKEETSEASESLKKVVEEEVKEVSLSSSISIKPNAIITNKSGSKSAFEMDSIFGHSPESWSPEGVLNFFTAHPQLMPSPEFFMGPPGHRRLFEQ